MTLLNIVFVASGSRGEVQPYIAIALALQSRGHHVAIATENRMKSLVEEEFGLPYRLLQGDPTGLLWQPYAQEALKNGSLFQLMSLTKKWDQQFDKMEILQSCVSACAGADIIIGANLTLLPTYCVSEYLKCAWFPIILGPTIMPTREFPLWIVPSWLTFCLPNDWFYWLVFKALWNQEKRQINQWRQETLKLAPITEAHGLVDRIVHTKHPIIVACSPLLCGPQRQVPKDYPSYIHLYGFAFVTTTSEEKHTNGISGDLKRFIQQARQSSQPIIYFGFGSMPAPDPEELIHIAFKVCQQLKCKGVLVTGWSGIDHWKSRMEESVETLFLSPSIPHDWLFPQMSCIIHHCGIGTTAAALRSGVPQIPCPVMLDQPHMAQVVLGLGVTPGILPFSKLSVHRLQALLQRAIIDPASSLQYRTCAQQCAEQIRHESLTSLERYCDLIEGHVKNFLVQNT